MYILTHFGKFLSENNGKIIQKSIDDVSSVDDLISIKKEAGLYSLGKNNSPFSFDSGLEFPNKAVTDDCIELIRSGNEDFIFIKTQKGFLSAQPNKDLECRSKPSLWEEFRILSKEEAEKIIFLSSKQILFEDKLLSFSENKTNIEYLYFGDVKIKIDDLFEDINCPLKSDIIFFDDYVPCVAKIVNPAILYILYGSGDILDQFKISIESLSMFGEYKGTIFIATDINKKFIKDVCKKHNLHNVFVIESRGFDRLDYVGSRIPLLSSDIFSRFQPIIYVDCDVIFNKPLKDNMQLFMKEEKISAQIEKNHYITNNASNGSTLYSQHPFPLLSKGEGFNAGIIMIPSWEKLNYAFKAAYRMLISYTIKFGRNSIPFYDQSILNYVFYKLNVFDGTSITNSVSIPKIENIHNQEKGFVHFWPHGRSRSTFMREYVAYLHKKYGNSFSDQKDKTLGAFEIEHQKS